MTYEENYPSLSKIITVEYSQDVQAFRKLLRPLFGVEI